MRSGRKRIDGNGVPEAALASSTAHSKTDVTRGEIVSTGSSHGRERRKKSIVLETPEE
jgi:hypothetical protein